MADGGDRPPISELSAWLGALFAAFPGIAVEPGRDRCSFGPDRIWLPDGALVEREGPGLRALRLAALAHVGAHVAFGTPFEVGSLRPVAIALVGLVEDARVEQRAMRAFPGLRRMWGPYHAAVADETSGAAGLFALLARTLFDPEREPANSWVRKGRDAFLAAGAGLMGPDESLAIGSILANDLGQMRVRFDPAAYRIEPLYRDDNLGLWRAPAAEEPRDSGDCSAARSSPAERQPASAGLPARDEPEEPVATYHEWDHFIGQNRDHWTSVREPAPAPASPVWLDRMRSAQAGTARRTARAVRSARGDDVVRFRRQLDGEQLDLDAVIAAATALRGRRAPEPGIHVRRLRCHRDLSVLILLDISESTRDFVRGTTGTVLNLQRDAIALLAEAMAGSGDRLAIHAFCSSGRSDVRYIRVKDFEDAYDRGTRERLSGLRSGLSTRLGAALRHAIGILSGAPSARRLILVMSDGEPSDVDVPDVTYLVEDARQAVMEGRSRNIDVVGISPPGIGIQQNARIFGGRRAFVLKRIEDLPRLIDAVLGRVLR